MAIFKVGDKTIFGCCYYPEHWPKTQWNADAKNMAKLGLTYVRIGEFAWSRMEPKAGNYQFDWLDRVIDVLAKAGLKVVLCTPTATPPKWLIDRWPEVLPVNLSNGTNRGFGSRRHYDFSSERYVHEALRITEVMASRYGSHPAVAGWQTDNELCCHKTTLSGSDNARQAFQQWCKNRYESIDALNTAWGNVFWSMEYLDFDAVELPIGAVTETNPSHRLAYHRFSSDQVVRFHRKMIEVIRQHAPNQFVTHNFIPMNETDVDNFALARDLDFSSYDNYPLGRTDLQFAELPTDKFRQYMRTGHPDFGSYYFDQTRGLNQCGFWVMEQQPGPVNWANNNPRPAPGMVRLWTLEAFAHGADCVSYFRWRQAPFAQEQMHAGLRRPDDTPSSVWPELEQVIEETRKLKLVRKNTHQNQVAIVTAAESLWVTNVERQSAAYDFNNVQFSYYSALRSIGVGVDFISEEADLSGYQLILVPCLPIVNQAFVNRCKKSSATIIFGPRSGSKTSEFTLPEQLPPGKLQQLIAMQISSVETLRADCTEAFSWNGQSYQSAVWREELDVDNDLVAARYIDNTPAIAHSGRFVYLGCLTDEQFLQDFLEAQCRSHNIPTYHYGDDIRIQRRANLCFAFNYSTKPCDLALNSSQTIVVGEPILQPHQVTVWHD